MVNPWILLAIPLLPALGALINGVRAFATPLEKKNRTITNLVALGTTGLSAALAVWTVLSYRGAEAAFEKVYYSWMPMGMGHVCGNGLADLGFVLGIFLIFNTFGSADYGKVFAAASAHPQQYAAMATTICLLLFVGACGKSAQIPLYVWLPDAMAGPTPVSALIHAATMVTAGVYMVVRSNILFRLSPTAMAVVAIVGAATAIFAATIGIAQNAIKKVLAYSPVSQLGYMFLGAGVGAFTAAIFHVITHAFFKACLFLGAGSVIHGCGGEQDMRKMGGLRKYMPWTHRTMLVATIAIAGIPPLAGFFSKDEILAGAWAYSKPIWILGAIAAGFTAFYMFRLYFMTFSGNSRGV